MPQIWLFQHGINIFNILEYWDILNSFFHTKSSKSAPYCTLIAPTVLTSQCGAVVCDSWMLSWTAQSWKLNLRNKIVSSQPSIHLLLPIFFLSLNLNVMLWCYLWCYLSPSPTIPSGLCQESSQSGKLSNWCALLARTFHKAKSVRAFVFLFVLQILGTTEESIQPCRLASSRIYPFQPQQVWVNLPLSVIYCHCTHPSGVPFSLLRQTVICRSLFWCPMPFSPPLPQNLSRLSSSLFQRK